MPPLESVLFLACFTLVPLAMIALLAYRFASWVRDRRTIATLHAAGWTPVDANDPALHDALDDLRITRPRARYFDRARHGDGPGAITIVTRRLRRRGGASEFGGSTITFAIATRTSSTPIGVVSRRHGGVLESVAAAAAEALGGVILQPPGWEWAIVSSPGTPGAWSSESGAALDAHVRPGEHVHLGASYVALAVRERPTSELMREARERLGAIRRALGD